MRKQDLEELMVEMTEEAGSNIDSGSMVVIHHNSPLLQDETEKLSDIAVNIKRKEK